MSQDEPPVDGWPIEISDTSVADMAESPDGCYLEGNRLWELGDIRNAIAAFQMAIYVAPDHVPSHCALGLLHLHYKHYEQAVEVFKKALSYKPDAADAHHGLGAAYGEMGRNEEALAEMQQAAQLDPQNPSFQRDLGVAYASLGCWQEAAGAYQEAIRLRPDFALAHYSLAIAYQQLRDLAAAQQEYETLRHIDREMAKELGQALVEIETNLA